MRAQLSRSRLLIVGMMLSIGSAHAAQPEFVAMSGKELYERFCSACHGAQGRGDGPVAASFKVEIPDLSLLARRAGGAFPRDRVERIIDGRSSLGAHGARTMPVWGQELGRLSIGDPDGERATRLILERLTDYVWQLQRPASADQPTGSPSSGPSSGKGGAR